MSYILEAFFVWLYGSAVDRAGRSRRLWLMAAVLVLPMAALIALLFAIT